MGSCYDGQLLWRCDGGVKGERQERKRGGWALASSGHMCMYHISWRSKQGMCTGTTKSQARSIQPLFGVFWEK
jgi:hypothetical protein